MLRILSSATFYQTDTESLTKSQKANVTGQVIFKIFQFHSFLGCLANFSRQLYGSFATCSLENNEQVLGRVI